MTQPAAHTTIVLVEDHTVLRVGLRALLNAESDLDVIGDAGSCAEGLEMVSAARPDMVITDVDLPDRTGLTLIPDLKALEDTICVIVLTSQCTNELVRTALEAGANGYVLKDARPSELLHGIRTVRQGKRFLSANVLSRISL